MRARNSAGLAPWSAEVVFCEGIYRIRAIGKVTFHPVLALTDTTYNNVIAGTLLVKGIRAFCFRITTH